MNDICRLCCSTKFVNNYIFDEDNALGLKMSVYLPIKVSKNDRLPQKLCDICCCKVNDFYQFYKTALEVQNRLRSILQLGPKTLLNSIDLSSIKRNESPVQFKLDQSTQTGDDLISSKLQKVEVKSEPPASLEDTLPADEEIKHESDHYEDHHSDSSEDMCLLVLKNKKEINPELNGIQDYSHKKNTKYKNFDSKSTSVPDDGALKVLSENVKLVVKKECDEVKESKVVLKKEDTSKEDTYQCCVCLSQCYTKAEMLKHYRQHEEQARAAGVAGGAGGAGPVGGAPPLPDRQPARCHRCKKVVGAAQWEGHWARHWARDRKPLRCALCERAFADAGAALRHGRTHQAPERPPAPAPASAPAPRQPTKRFVCDVCPQSFVYMRFLLAHRSVEHPECALRPLALRCGQCSREFAHLNSLRRHLHGHTGERNFLCNVCGKALSSREHLKFHIRIHTGHKPHVCRTCGKGFVKKCNLTLHERVHSGEKPHVCSHCGKAFSQRSTLVIHERYHSGARPYKCALCARGFVAKGLLSVHLKTTCI